MLLLAISSVLDPDYFIDDIQWATLYLIVDACDVFPNEAQRDELDTPHEQHRYDNRRPAGHQAVGKDLESYRIYDVDQTHTGDDKAEIHGELEGDKREGNDPIESE